MSLPGSIIDLPTLTEKDEDDIIEFGLKYGVDYISASFVRKSTDIDNIRDILGQKGAQIKVLAKIENHEGLQNFEEILLKADGIIISRA
jgi:pyruvate kinase